MYDGSKHSSAPQFFDLPKTQNSELHVRNLLRLYDELLLLLQYPNKTTLQDIKLEFLYIYISNMLIIKLFTCPGARKARQTVLRKTKSSNVKRSLVPYGNIGAIVWFVEVAIGMSIGCDRRANARAPEQQQRRQRKSVYKRIVRWRLKQFIL